MATPKKKAAPKNMPVREFLEDHTLEEAAEAVDAIAAENVVSIKSKAKPGEKDYDWAAEYPGEQFYVYTSPKGLTIGLAAMSTARKPKPGKLRRLHREGGLSVMWYFVELVSSPTSLDLQEELDEVDYTAMLRGWADFAGIELSE